MTFIKNLITKFREKKVHLELWNTALFIMSRVLDTVTISNLRLIKYYLFAQPITAQPITMSLASDHYGISQVGSFTLSWVGADCPVFAQTERSSSVLAARFDQGARCLLATHSSSGEFAGFLWFVVGPYDEDEVRARFISQPVDTTAWDFDVAIVPRFRMSRLFSYLWRVAMAEMCAIGVTHSLSRISAFNATSRNSHQRLGGLVVGQATFICAGRIQLMISSLKPCLHISWCDKQRPKILVSSNIHQFNSTRIQGSTIASKASL